MISKYRVYLSNNILHNLCVHISVLYDGDTFWERYKMYLHKPRQYSIGCGTGDVIGTTIVYGLDGPGIEFRRGRDFPHMSSPALGPNKPSVQWVPGVPGGKERPGRDAEPSPLPVPWSRKSRAKPLFPLWAVRPVQGLSACTVELYLQSPYGPYSLYRASVSVQ